jgi:hypothetical protein
MNLEDLLKQSAEELATAEADLQAAQQKVDELRTIHEGMRLAQQRYGQQIQAVPASQTRTAKASSNAGRRPRRKTTKRSQPSLSDKCYQVLVDDKRPASSAEVREILEGQGYVLDAEQVRSAFAYLLRRERVVRVETGVWDLPPDVAASIRTEATLNGIDGALKDDEGRGHGSVEGSALEPDRPVITPKAMDRYRSAN